MKSFNKISVFCATTVLLAACGGGSGSGGSSSGGSSSGGSSSGGSSSGSVSTTKSKIHLSILDAAAGYVLGGSDIKLSFKGLPVLDSSGAEITELTVAGDNAQDIVLSLKDIPTTEKDLVILAEAVGYNDTGTSIIITPQAIEQTINLKMTKDTLGKIANGIFSNQIDISSYIDPDTGMVTSEIVLNSKESATSPGVQVKIPVGTILKDKDGNNVTDGILKIVAFDPSKPNALAAYPGGLNVLANATGFTLNGTPTTGKQQINFKTAGFADITIESDDGREVKTFNQDIEIAMQFVEGTTDGDGNVVTAGMSVPIWSFEQTTGEWTFEEDGTAVVGTLSDGLLDVVYNTNHLTAWNLDWHYSAVCTANINVIDPNGTNSLSLVDHFVVDIPDAPIIRTLPNNDPSSGTMLLYNVPLGYLATVTAYDANGAVFGSVSAYDLCDGNEGPGGWNSTINNQVDLLTGPVPPPTDVTMTLSCPGGNNIPGTNSPTIAFPAVLSSTNGNNFTTLDANGAGQVGIAANSTQIYDVTASSSANVQSMFSAIDSGNSANPANNQVTITSGTAFTQDFVLSNAFCSATSGSIDGASCGAPRIAQSGSVIDVAKDSQGNLYASTSQGGIVKTDVNGNVTTLIAQGMTNYPSATPTASNDDANEVETKKPFGLDIYEFNGGEYLLYADKTAHCVNRVDLNTNKVITIAGQCGMNGDLSSTAGSFDLQCDPLFDMNGDPIPGSELTNCTEIINPSNFVNATDGLMNQPTDVAYYSQAHTVNISDPGNGRVYLVSADDHLWSIAGTGSPISVPFVGTPDALTTSIRPSFLDVDSQGQVVFSEAYGHRVSRIEGIAYVTHNPVPNGVLIRLKRLAGDNNSVAGFSGDGGLAINSKLTRPIDIEIDVSDNILIASFSNGRVRRIEAGTMKIETIAGTGGIFNTIDPCGPATQQNVRPFGLWIEDNADFYITQYLNDVIRHVTY